ncbi:hypothetical protein EDB85DRAFT_2145453 [Lactarius pseudohatsudake]|nr:hypothetical protein EDB85DRAFT_2145453 [Lactarius pseudohatsudake]
MQADASGNIDNCDKGNGTTTASDDNEYIGNDNDEDNHSHDNNDDEDEDHDSGRDEDNRRGGGSGDGNGDQKSGKEFLDERLCVDAGIAPEYRGDSARLQNIVRFLADIKDMPGELNRQWWSSKNADHIPFLLRTTTISFTGAGSSLVFEYTNHCSHLLGITLGILATPQCARHHGKPPRE